MSDHEEHDDEIELHGLTDRELLILTCKTVNGLTKQASSTKRRVRNLEHWRTFLTGAFVGITGSFWHHIKEVLHK